MSTATQDLDRQVDALRQAGISAKRIYVDRKSGATVDRQGMRAVLDYSRDTDVIVVHTLDRLGRTVRDTLNLIHELPSGALASATWPTRSGSTRPARTTPWRSWRW